MGEVLDVRDAFLAQMRAMLIQESKVCRLYKKFASPQLVQLNLVPVLEDILHIRYRCAEQRLPKNVDIDAVAASTLFLNIHPALAIWMVTAKFPERTVCNSVTSSKEVRLTSS